MALDILFGIDSWFSFVKGVIGDLSLMNLLALIPWLKGFGVDNIRAEVLLCHWLWISFLMVNL